MGCQETKTTEIESSNKKIIKVNENYDKSVSNLTNSKNSNNYNSMIDKPHNNNIIKSNISQENEKNEEYDFDTNIKLLSLLFYDHY